MTSSVPSYSCYLPSKLVSAALCCPPIISHIPSTRPFTDYIMKPRSQAYIFRTLCLRFRVINRKPTYCHLARYLVHRHLLGRMDFRTFVSPWVQISSFQESWQKVGGTEDICAPTVDGTDTKTWRQACINSEVLVEENFAESHDILLENVFQNAALNVLTTFRYFIKSSCSIFFTSNIFMYHWRYCYPSKSIRSSNKKNCFSNSVVYTPQNNNSCFAIFACMLLIVCIGYVVIWRTKKC